MWISCKDAVKRAKPHPSHQSCIKLQLASSAILCCPLTTLTICCILTLFSCSRLSYLSESLPDPLALSSSQLSHFRSERQCAASLSQLRQRLDPMTSVVVVAGRCEFNLHICSTHAHSPELSPELSGASLNSEVNSCHVGALFLALVVLRAPSSQSFPQNMRDCSGTMRKPPDNVLQMPRPCSLATLWAGAL